jgi:hypothetical protein
MFAGWFIHVSLPLSRFHFPANCITNTERTCHVFLSPASRINHITATIITLIKLWQLCSAHYNKRRVKHNKRARCHNNQHSALNGWQIAEAEHLFLLQALSYDICMFLRISRNEEFVVTFTACYWGMMLAETASDDSWSWPNLVSFQMKPMLLIIYARSLFIALMVEVVRTSETSVHSNETKRRYVQEDSKLHTRRRENLKPYTLTLCSYLNARDQVSHPYNIFFSTRRELVNILYSCDLHLASLIEKYTHCNPTETDEMETTDYRVWSL